MFEIAICDDCENDAQQLLQAIEQQYIGQFKIRCFLLPQALRDAIIDWNYRPAFVLMDIELGAINGIDWAEMLYVCCPEMRFIFVTRHETRYAQSIFLKRITPLGYLSKPVQPALLQVLLEKLLAIVRQDNAQSLQIKTKTRVQYIPHYLIVSMESRGHYIYINTTQEVISCVEKLDNLEHQLPNNFLRAHKSYIINMDYADTIENNEFLLPDYRVPVSRTRLAEVKRTYFAYKGSSL